MLSCSPSALLLTILPLDCLRGSKAPNLKYFCQPACIIAKVPVIIRTNIRGVVMRSGGFSGGQYRPLAEEQVKIIHEASLSILEKIGFTYEKGLGMIIDLASIIAGTRKKLMEKPFFSIIASFAISPLKLSTQPTLIMQEACRHHIPVALSSAPAAGMLESMLTVAYEQYVIDDEIMGMCCKALRGIEVDPEHLALETIQNVGPGGNFMTSPHTLEYMRSEFFEGNGVSDRQNREKWEQEGSLDARMRAREIARELISGAPESYLPEEVDKTIRKKFNILLSKGK